MMMHTTFVSAYQRAKRYADNIEPLGVTSRLAG